MEKQKKTRTMSPEMLEKLALARERAKELRNQKKVNTEIVSVPPVSPLEPKSETMSEPKAEPKPEPAQVEPLAEKVKPKKVKKEIVVVSSDDDSSGDEEYVIKIPKRTIKAKRLTKQKAPEPVPEPVPVAEIVKETKQLPVSPEPKELPRPRFSPAQHLTNLARFGYVF